MFFRFKNTNFFFYHIPKTAGSTVKYALSQNDLDYNIYYRNLNLNGILFKILNNKFRFHEDINLLKKIFKKNFYYEIVKFTTVRNPYDRLVSLYTWLKSGSKSDNLLNLNNDLYIQKYMDSLNRKSFILKGPQNTNRLKNISFSDFIKNFNELSNPTESRRYINEDTKSFNFFIRFEYLENDLNLYLSKYGIKINNLDIKINQSSRNHYREYYNSETKNIVESLFKSDIEYFDYKF